MFSSDPALVSNQLPVSLDFPSDPDELNLFVQALLKRIANAVNTKEGALYVPQEVASFQQYFTANNSQKFRNVYRKVIDFGVLPDTAVKTVAHGIAFNSDFSTTRIYGSATDPTNLEYLPLPYADPDPTKCISLFANGTFVVIQTGTARSNFTRCTVVIEYTKNL
jgi:ABC-type glycerol-3-phosphate transport system substrate-binding protein